MYSQAGGSVLVGLSLQSLSFQRRRSFCGLGKCLYTQWLAALQGRLSKHEDLSLIPGTRKPPTVSSLSMEAETSGSWGFLVSQGNKLRREPQALVREALSYSR